MHKLANRVLLAELRDAGLLQGDVDEMMKVSARQLRKLPFLMQSVYSIKNSTAV
jgi:hypothetical protein